MNEDPNQILIDSLPENQIEETISLSPDQEDVEKEKLKQREISRRIESLPC